MLVQRHQGRGQCAVEIDGRGTRTRAYPRQCDLPGDGRNGHVRLGNGNAGYAAESCEVKIDDTPGPLLQGVRRRLDGKSVVEGKSVSVRVDHGGRRYIKKK